MLPETSRYISYISSKYPRYNTYWINVPIQSSSMQCKLDNNWRDFHFATRTVSDIIKCNKKSGLILLIYEGKLHVGDLIAWWIHVLLLYNWSSILQYYYMCNKNVNTRVLMTEMWILTYYYKKWVIKMYI